MERENGFYWVCYKNDSVENNWVIKQWNGAMWYDKAQSKDSDLIIDERKIVRKKDATLIAAAPKMLEALQNLENDTSQIPKHAWKMVQDAILCAVANER